MNPRGRFTFKRPSTQSSTSPGQPLARRAMAAPGAFWWPALSSSMRCPTLVARAVRNPRLPGCCPCLPRPVLGGLAGPVAAALAWRRAAHIVGNGRDGGSPWRPTPRRAVRCLSGAQAAAVGCATALAAWWPSPGVSCAGSVPRSPGRTGAVPQAAPLLGVLPHEITQPPINVATLSHARDVRPGQRCRQSGKAWHLTE